MRLSTISLISALATVPVVGAAEEYQNGAEFHAPFLQQPDTRLHIAASAVGTVALVEVFDMKPRDAFLTMMAVGLVKEYLDKDKPFHDAKDRREDMAANVIGAGSVYLSYTIKF